MQWNKMFLKFREASKTIENIKIGIILVFLSIEMFKIFADLNTAYVTNPCKEQPAHQGQHHWGWGTF